MKKIIIIFLCFLVNHLVVASAEDVKIIEAVSYYEYAPFSIDEENKIGLVFDFVELLNKYLEKEKIKFVAKIYPRKRIDEILEHDSALVLFVNPKWMNDVDKSKYLWSNKIINGSNDVLSRSRGPGVSRIDYTGMESLLNLRMGGVLGRHYHGIDDYVRWGEIKREDSLKEHMTLLKLVGGRVDFVTMQSLMARNLIKELGIEDEIYISPYPLFRYTRHILMTKNLVEESKVVFDFVNRLNQVQEWQEIKAKYSLQEKEKGSSL